MCISADAVVSIILHCAWSVICEACCSFSCFRREFGFLRCNMRDCESLIPSTFFNTSKKIFFLSSQTHGNWTTKTSFNFSNACATLATLRLNWLWIASVTSGFLKNGQHQCSFRRLALVVGRFCFDPVVCSIPDFHLWWVRHTGTSVRTSQSCYWYQQRTVHRTS